MEQEEGAMTVSQQESGSADYALVPIKDLAIQVNHIQEVMRSLMKEGEHYGKIPGCGPKPALLKAGAEKLLFAFRFVPKVTSEVILPIEHSVKGHREYRLHVTVYTKGGAVLADGVGSCSTMEGKYRFRDGKELTDQVVPKAYWDLKKAGKTEEAQSKLGGKGNGTQKGTDGVWYITKGSGQKVEYDNPADFYNTCYKMAFKRAFVAAAITACSASDLFTQDIEEMADIIGSGAQAPIPPDAPIATQSAPRPEKAPEPAKAPEVPEPPAQVPTQNNPGGGATEPQVKLINTLLGNLLKALNLPDSQRHEYLSKMILGLPNTISSVKDLTKAQASEAIKVLKTELANTSNGGAEYDPDATQGVSY